MSEPKEDNNMTNNHELMEAFSERLKQVRNAASLSQQGMADRMLIPKRTIEKWETGERTPPEYVQRFVLLELVTLVPEDEQLEAQLKSGVYSDNDIIASQFMKGKTIEEINREIEREKERLKVRQ